MNTVDYRVHEDWATPAFERDPLAADIGPFASRGFLRSWHEDRGADGKVMLVESSDGLLPLYAEDETIRFLGEADLTDYHSPLGSAAAVARLTEAFFCDASAGTRFELDSLPTEAADPVAAGLEAAGISFARGEHEVAAVLTLPGSFEEWLAALGKKERHEVRRKRRRFESELGSPHLRRATGSEAIEVFAQMHRAAAGEKGSFMTAAMQEFFDRLHRKSRGVIDVLANDGGTPVAVAFGFEDDRGYYLYNSAYDPAVRHASPGIVMLASLIERAVDNGSAIFDFLKGDEAYKFRHGAVRRPLISLTGIVKP